MRIAHVMGKMNGGGVEAVVMDFYRHIDRSRFQFDFLVDSDSTLVPREEIWDLGGRVIDVPPYQHALAYSRELELLFRTEGWNVVHSHLNALSVLPLRAARLAGVGIRIAHAHSTGGRRTARSRNASRRSTRDGSGLGSEPWRDAAKSVLKAYSNTYPTHRFACSAYAGRWLFGDEDFTVIPNGIRADSFAFNARLRRETRLQLGLKPSDIAIGHIGRFAPQKNHAFLIAIMRELERADNGIRLLMAGDGKLRGDIERLVRESGLSGKVSFLGYRSDANRLYQSFDAFCLPSLYEGLPIVALEAQAAGLPCVMSDAVTQEAAISETARFVPLAASPRTWATCIIDAIAKCNRDNRAIGLGEHDIRVSAQLLARQYELACTCR